jgi:hypothetical protein
MDVVVTKPTMLTIDAMTESTITAAEKLVAEQSQCIAAVRRLLEASANKVTANQKKTSRSSQSIYRKICSEISAQFGETLSQCILETASLQTKAKRKLGRPHKHANANLPEATEPVWWATRRSLQQATPWQVADLKATWFNSDPVYDLCCAMGGDSMGFANRHALVAVDRDPILTAMAELNLRQTCSDNDWVVQTADVTAFPIPSQSAIHIDPDRRVTTSATSNQRTIAADQFSPDWEFVKAILTQARSGIVKLAPATRLDWSPAEIPTHRVWIALQGTVREQSMLVGDAVQAANLPAGQRSAYRLAADGSWQRFVATADDQTDVPSIASPGQWLIDPVSSIRAAGLTQAFAQTQHLALLGDASGFLTSDRDDLPDQVTAMASVGRIVWTGSAADRKLRKELRAHGWFPETIKCRGVDHDPATLFRRYRDCGETPVTLWIGRAGKKVYAAVSR